jgi:hypothetical protein
LLVLDGQVHHDTHALPIGNYVIEAGNYVIVSPSELGNYVSADSQRETRRMNLERLAFNSGSVADANGHPLPLRSSLLRSPARRSRRR